MRPLPSPSRCSAMSSAAGMSPLTTTLLNNEGSSAIATPIQPSDAADASTASPSAAAAPASLLCAAGYWTAVFTITNAALGAGVLSFPFAFLNAGILPGISLLLVFGALCFASLCVVVAATHHVQTRRPDLVSISLGDVCAHICGERTARTVDALIVIQGEDFKKRVETP